MNKQFALLFDEWADELENLGEEWWNSFEQDVKQHRLSFRNMDELEDFMLVKSGLLEKWLEQALKETPPNDWEKELDEL